MEREKFIAKLPSEKFKVSFSSLDTFKTCPRKYYYNYLLKLPRIDRPWFSFGNFNHLVLEKFYNVIIRCKKVGKEYDRKQIMYKAFYSALKRFRKDTMKGRNGGITADQLYESKGLLKRYLEKIQGAEPEVMWTERKFEVDLGEGVLIRGFIDRVDRIDENTFQIVDYKTSSKTYKPDKNHQLNIYALALKSILAMNDIKIFKQLDFIKLGKETKPWEHDNSSDKAIVDELVSEAIEIREKIELHKNDQEAWEPIENKFCWACDFKDRCDRDRGLKQNEFTWE